MQRLKQAIRRVAALGVGVAMLGATVTGAVAQAASLDLANLPEPFVSGEGVYNDDTALVVGSKADVSDTLGVSDVAAKLQFLSKQAVSTSGTVTVSGGVTEDVPIGLGIANSTTVALDFSLEKSDITSFFDGTINFQDEDIEAHDELIFTKTSPSVKIKISLVFLESSFLNNKFKALLFPLFSSSIYSIFLSFGNFSSNIHWISVNMKYPGIGKYFFPQIDSKCVSWVLPPPWKIQISDIFIL